MTGGLPPEHGDKFTGPVTFEGPTLDTILRGLRAAKLPESEQRAAVQRAAAAGRLFPLEREVLREAGWL